MVTFDPSRPEFAPYGFTCECWTPEPMQRADRHNEIELNLLKRGSLTYLLGGQHSDHSRRPAGGLLGEPFRTRSSRRRTRRSITSPPFRWRGFCNASFPAHFVDAILHARVVLDPEPQTRGGDMEMFERWVHDFENPTARRTPAHRFSGN